MPQYSHGSSQVTNLTSAATSVNFCNFFSRKIMMKCKKVRNPCIPIVSSVRLNSGWLCTQTCVGLVNKTGTDGMCTRLHRLPRPADTRPSFTGHTQTHRASPCDIRLREPTVGHCRHNRQQQQSVTLLVVGTPEQTNGACRRACVRQCVESASAPP